MIQRWYQFMRERFDPLSHIIMIAVFFGANAVLLQTFLFHDPATFLFGRATTTGLIAFLFFFHLRLFDELKDYQTDCEVNRDRPLPRGLISLGEFKTALWMVIATELALATLLGMKALTAFLIPLIYSILMYREFFIGNWLRPKMEAYAISHTFVSGLLAVFFGSALFNVSLAEQAWPIFLVIGNNWMIFNTFEFARKTFGQAEERANVESYSKRWKPLGAFLWTFAFTSLSMMMLSKLQQLMGWKEYFLYLLASITALVWIAGAIYSFTPQDRWAKIYRATATAYLIFFNLIIVICGLLSR